MDVAVRSTSVSASITPILSLIGRMGSVNCTSFKADTFLFWMDGSVPRINSSEAVAKGFVPLVLRLCWLKGIL